MSDIRVLVVDDAPDIRWLVEDLVNLHDHGWQVVAMASNGLEGIERAASVQPDLVLLDVSMPVMDGLAALPLVRKAAPQAIIVIFTGFPSSAVRDSALEAGADGYVEKDELVSGLLPQLESIVASVRSSETGPHC